MLFFFTKKLDYFEWLEIRRSWADLEPDDLLVRGTPD